MMRCKTKHLRLDEPEVFCFVLGFADMYQATDQSTMNLARVRSYTPFTSSRENGSG